MSKLRTRFVSAAVVLTGLFAGNAIAQEPGGVQQIRDWAAERIRGESGTMFSGNASVSTENSNSIPEQLLDKGQGFFAQIGGLVEQQVGWLRPTNVKEQALLWIAIAMALPWGFVGFLRPILKYDLFIVRMLVVSNWTGIALWSAWSTWGIGAGSDRFASTMLFGVPMLLVYFNSVARSVAAPEKP